MRAAIRIDDDDFCFGTLPAIERSFEVTLPRDLTEIATAGDLFSVVTALSPVRADGNGCDSQMAFYRLRGVLPDDDGSALRPDTPLLALRLGSVRGFARRLGDQTGFALPAFTVSSVGLALAAIAALTCLALAILQDPVWGALALLAPLLILALDRGQWTGDWRTAGSLAQALARHNAAALAREGVRDTHAQRWRRFGELLCEYAQVDMGGNERVDPREITRDTRLVLT